MEQIRHGNTPAQSLLNFFRYARIALRYAIFH